MTQDILRAIQLQLGEGAVVSSRLLPAEAAARRRQADAAEADADGEEAEAESERATWAKASGR